MLPQIYAANSRLTQGSTAGLDQRKLERDCVRVRQSQYDRTCEKRRNGSEVLSGVSKRCG